MLFTVSGLKNKTHSDEPKAPMGETEAEDASSLPRHKNVRADSWGIHFVNKINKLSSCHSKFVRLLGVEKRVSFTWVLTVNP